MKLLLSLPLAVLVVAHLGNAYECNEGMNKWFLPFGREFLDKTTWPNNQKFQICQPLNAYGTRYVDGFRVVVRGGNGVGSLQVYPRSGYNSPGAFDIRISQGKYEPTSLGIAHMRVTESETDLERIQRIINEGFPCINGGGFRPIVAFVVTFTCLKHKRGDAGARDTFQAILAVNGQRMYVVLNYHRLNDAGGLQFALVNRLSKNKFFFANVNRRNLPEELVSHTNGARSGVWVYDVTEDQPRRPDHCNKEIDECTMTNFGSIQTFNGEFTVAPYEIQTPLAEYIKEPSYECNLIASVRMEVHGDVKYMEMSVGTFDPAEERDKSMTHFDFDRITGTARIRGGGRPRAETLDVSVPYVWKQGNNVVRIRKTDLGWTLASDFCGYRMEFRPDGHEPEMILYRGEDYKGLLTGLCTIVRSDIYP